MKAKNWRKYWWFNPLHFVADQRRLTDDQIKAREASYINWLIAAGKVTLDEAEFAAKVAEAQRDLDYANERLADAERSCREKPRSDPRRRDRYSAERRVDECGRALAAVAELRAEALREKAEAYARSQRTGLLSAAEDRESNLREYEWLADGCIIRTVRCPTAKAREEFDGEEWRRLIKPDAPTTYAVILNGRCVNSFLSKAAAKRWAIAKLQAA